MRRVDVGRLVYPTRGGLTGPQLKDAARGRAAVKAFPDACIASVPASSTLFNARGEHQAERHEPLHERAARSAAAAVDVPVVAVVSARADDGKAEVAAALKI